MADDWIYLDYNASTPMAKSVVSRMTESLQFQAHPSSSHPHGVGAKAEVEWARAQVAQSLGSHPSEIVFGSGSTEAANHVIKGVCYSFPVERKLHFISSVVDHAATLKPLEFLQSRGHEVTLVPVDKTGRLNPADVRNSLRDDTVLVSLIQGQNEVGTVQPLEEIGAILEQHQAQFHVDASQSFGKIPVNVKRLRADFLNIAGHKIYGPKGVGALFVREGCSLEPLLHGGGHETGRRSGTPAPQLAVGIGEACRLVLQHGSISSDPAELLWSELSNSLGADVARNGHAEERLPNVLHLTFRGVEGRALLNAARICASTGAACHSAATSPVLAAMGLSLEDARGSVRLSTGRDTDLETARTAASRLVEAYKHLAKGVPVT